MSSDVLHFYGKTPDQFTEEIISDFEAKLQELFPTDQFQDEIEEELLTVEEAQAIFKCSKQALWNWRKSGILPSYRLGNSVYYKRSDINQMLLRED